MRLALILTAALAFGCDDPNVGAKALDVLEHGFVAAELRCECTFGGGNNYSLGLTAQKLIDGSCLVSGSLTRLWARSEAGAATCALGAHSSSHVSEIDATYLYAGPEYWSDESAPYAVSLSTCCTGFNFEAFIGAE